MGKNKHFASESITQFIALQGVGHETIEIAQFTDVCERSLRHWLA